MSSPHVRSVCTALVCWLAALKARAGRSRSRLRGCRRHRSASRGRPFEPEERQTGPHPLQLNPTGLLSPPVLGAEEKAQAPGRLTAPQLQVLAIAPIAKELRHPDGGRVVEVGRGDSALRPE